MLNYKDKRKRNVSKGAGADTELSAGIVCITENRYE